MNSELKTLFKKNVPAEISELRKNVLDLFIEKLKDIHGNNLKKIVLFGSVARGDSEPDSDLDVCIIMSDGDKFDLLDRIIDISYDIDMYDGNFKTHISPFVRTFEEYQNSLKLGIPVYRNIEEEGVVLYDSER